MRFTHRRNLWKAVKNIVTPKQNPHKIVTTGYVSPLSAVPEHIIKPEYVYGDVPQRNKFIDIKSKEEIDRMREAGRLAKHVLMIAKSHLQSGITTDEIDKIVHSEIIKHGAYPSPLLYKGFPKSCCTSVNNVACHGVPDDRKLLSGDVINIDVTVFHHGCHGDTSDTFIIGQSDPEGLQLIDISRDSLHRAIEICKPGNSFRKIGETIESISRSAGFSVCRNYVGHGIGSYFHGPPNVYHYATALATKQLMEPGMTFTIEPIIMEGSSDVVVLPDGWTVVSIDGCRSAQTEHTILITEKDCEVLT